MKIKNESLSVFNQSLDDEFSRSSWSTQRQRGNVQQGSADGEGVVVAYSSSSFHRALGVLSKADTHIPPKREQAHHYSSPQPLLLSAHYSLFLYVPSLTSAASAPDDIRPSSLEKV